MVSDIIVIGFHYYLRLTITRAPGAVDSCKEKGFRNLKKLKVKKQSHIKGLFHH